MIVGFCGYAQSGKDTAAQVLIEGSWTRRAFADALRDLAYLSNPIVFDDDDSIGNVWRLRVAVDRFGWDTVKRWPTVRQYLQDLGNGARQALGPHIWVDTLHEWCADLWAQRVVIPDVRYPNEADWVRLHGYLIRVERPGCGPVNGHISETALDHYAVDATVHNTGDIAGLHQVVRRALADLGVDLSVTNHDQMVTSSQPNGWRQGG